MKKLLLILWACVLTLPSTAQTAGRGLWCPPGATWKHQFQTTLVPPTLVAGIVRYTGDSLVNGQVCQVLNNLGTRQLTRSDADRVWQHVQGQFYKVHDFSARPGDSWPYLFSYGSCAQTVTMTVDSVGQQQLGGQLRRWFVAHYVTATGQMVRWGRVYEGIGTLNEYMFPTVSSALGCIIAPETPRLLGLSCFSTGAQPGLLSLGSGCQAVPTATHEAQAAAAGFAVYPTSSSGTVTLRLPAAYDRALVQVYDPTGRQVWQRALTSAAETTLALDQLPRGLYVVRLQQAGLPLLSQRVLLQ
jgi:hypothetical protein